MQIQIDKYNTLELDEYQGKYYINLLGPDKAGEKWYKKWVFEAYRKDGENVPGDKSRPLKIPLGELGKAKDALRAFLDELPDEAQKPLTDGHGKPINEDDIPF